MYVKYLTQKYIINQNYGPVRDHQTIINENFNYFITHHTN